MKRHTFTTRIAKIGILRCVIVPPHIVKALGSETRIPVLARYGGETILSTLAPAGSAKRRLVVQMSVLRPASRDVGDRIEVSLESTTESHKQWLPPDVARAAISSGGSRGTRPLCALDVANNHGATRAGAHAGGPTAADRTMIERLAEMAAARANKKGSSEDALDVL